MNANYFLRTFRPLLALCLSGIIPSALAAPEPAKIFSSPEEAVRALGEAVNTTNRVAFAALFGEAAETLANPDSVQGARELADFTLAFNQTNRLVRDSDRQMTLEVGPEAWPLPVPLIKVGGGWQFDAQAGLEEWLNRRIGRNELDVLSVLRAYVEIQRDYASRDRDGDRVLEYAQRIRSSPGQTDGLFWSPELNGEISPAGPFFAFAQGEGYDRQASQEDSEPQPFHGYLFKILTRQGKNAPGGKYDYIINGNMIGGFAVVAWPAEYGTSGIMTFIVNQEGRIYQKDLGTATDKAARKMKIYDPDPNWHMTQD